MKPSITIDKDHAANSDTGPTSGSVTGIATAKMAGKHWKKSATKTSLYQKAQKIVEKLQNESKPTSSLEKLTGKLFSLENDIPVPLRAPLEGLAERILAMDAQVEAFKPSIELLIYWENFTGSIFVSLSILLTWIFSTVGFHWLWVIIILFITNGALKRNAARLKQKIFHDAKVIHERKRIEDEKEVAEWINLILEKFWSQYEPTLSETIASNVNWVLESQKPAFLEELKLSQFTLGSEAPRVESIKSYTRTPDDLLMMDMQASFEPFDEDNLSKRQRSLTNKRNSKIELIAKIGKGVASIPIPVLVTDIFFTGTIRIQIKFCTTFPHIEFIEFGCTEYPKIDFILRPLKGMDLMDLPGLSSFIKDIMKWVLETSVIDPVTIKIPVLELMSGGVDSDPVVGILAINVLNGSTLKNTEITGLSDPYCKLIISGTEQSRTKVISDSLNPVWNEVKYIILRKSHVEPGSTTEFSVEVMDFNNLSKDRPMGTTESLKLYEWLLLEDDDQELTIEQKHLIESWGHPLGQMDSIKKELFSESKKRNGGSIRLRLSYHKISPCTPDAPKSNSGIISFTIHQAKEIPIPSKSCNAFCTVEFNNGLEISKTGVRKRTNAPVWEHKLEYFVEDVDSARFKFVVKEEKDLGSNFIGSTLVNLSSLLQKVDSNNDWFALNDGKTGKIRLSFKFHPISLDSSINVATRYPLGVAKVNIKEAKGLLNVEAFKKSDPYTVFHVDQRLIGRTHTIDNTLDPSWNETYYCLVYSVNSTLQFEVFDFNNFTNDRKLGKTQIPISKLFPTDILLNKNPPATSALRDSTDNLRQNTMELMEKDGFRLNRDSGFCDTWCPLYLIQEMIPGIGKSIQDLTSIVKEKDKIKQKGHLHLQVDFFPSINDLLIVAEKINEVSQSQVIESPSEASPESTRRVSKLPEQDRITAIVIPDATLDRVYTQDESASPETIGSKMSYAVRHQLILKTASDHPTGILRIKVHDITGLSINGNIFCRLRLQDQVDFYDTEVLKNTNEPIFDEFVDLLAKNIHVNKVLIEVFDKAPTKDSEDTLLGTFKILELVEILGSSYMNIKSDKEPEMRISCSYLPVELNLQPHELGDSKGKLTVEIISASNLEAVDSNGLSDPYCHVILNGQKVFKTKTHKKTLNPVFDEQFSVPIDSRQRSNLVIEVKDYNKLQKHVVIGTLEFPLSQLVPGNVMEGDFSLEGTVQGTLCLRLLFAEGDKIDIPVLPKRTRTTSVSSDMSRTSSARDSHYFGRLSRSFSNNLEIRKGDLEIQIIAARDLKAVDSNGLSDPFVKVVHNYHGKMRTVFKTSVVKKSLNPTFDPKKDHFKVHFPPCSLRFIIKDYNLFGESKDLGESEVDFTEFIDQNELQIDKWLPITMGGSGELHIKAKIHLSNEAQSQSQAMSPVTEEP